jgi:hypothetical protein
MELRNFCSLTQCNNPYSAVWMTYEYDLSRRNFQRSCLMKIMTSRFSKVHTATWTAHQTIR